MCIFVCTNLNVANSIYFIKKKKYSWESFISTIILVLVSTDEWKQWILKPLNSHCTAFYLRRAKKILTDVRQNKNYNLDKN